MTKISRCSGCYSKCEECSHRYFPEECNNSSDIALLEIQKHVYHYEWRKVKEVIDKYFNL